MGETNTNSRIEAFSDGVFAIALTLLILDIKIPSSLTIASTSDLWLALNHLAPSVLAFLLSFMIILITWVNHHATLKLVNRSSTPFMYANGLFLLTVVIMPFPTALLGEYLFTDHAAPAVILYSVVCGFQAVGWLLLTWTALKPTLLTKDDRSTQAMGKNHRYSYFAFALYATCAFAAVWFPQTVALTISLIWIVWLIVGMNVTGERSRSISDEHRVQPPIPG